MGFELKSPAFGHLQRIPAKYTADGEDISPRLEWTGVPKEARSFALIVEDRDAPSGTFRDWGVYNIVAGRDRLPEGVGHGAKTEDLGMSVNDFGEPRYRGPAPPKGHGTHRYHFKILALDVESLSGAPKATVDDIRKAAEGHIIGEAELIGTYSR